MKSFILLKWRGIYLAVLGQVEGGDLLRLLDLLLVRLDLALQLVDQGLHPLVVLAVLVLQDIDNELIWFCFDLLESQLLDMPLGLAKVLLRIGHPPVLSVDLRLELPDPGLHLRHCLLAPLQRVLLCFVKP